VPAVFAGAPVTVYLRCLERPVPGQTVTVHGRLPAGTATALTVVLDSVAPGVDLEAAWGRARIRDLEDRYAAGESTSALEREIVATSLRHRVLSRFTAFVAIDRAVVNPGGTPRGIVQPVEPPAGWAQAEQARTRSGIAPPMPAPMAGGGLPGGGWSNAPTAKPAMPAKHKTMSVSVAAAPPADWSVDEDHEEASAEGAADKLSAPAAYAPPPPPPAPSQAPAAAPPRSTPVASCSGCSAPGPTTAAAPTASTPGPTTSGWRCSPTSCSRPPATRSRRPQLAADRAPAQAGRDARSVSSPRWPRRSSRCSAADRGAQRRRWRAARRSRGCAGRDRPAPPPSAARALVLEVTAARGTTSACDRARWCSACSSLAAVAATARPTSRRSR
jgi:hypothetical protein